MTTDFLDSEMVNPESPFEPRKYRVTYCCQLCGHKWKSRWLKTVPKKDPECPNPSCAEVTQLRRIASDNDRLRAMLEEQRAPGLIGASTMVKAVDATAEIVMQDYKLTDLKDNVRAGESVAPKLPPNQQALADGVFGGGKHGMSVKDPQTGQVRSLQAEHLNRIGRRALAGAFRASAVAPNQILAPEMRTQAPLRMVREEKFQR